VTDWPAWPPAQDRAMDSNTMERERGITIFSKTTSFLHK
jgi:predicted membrane GTPase involved in stress response